MLMHHIWGEIYRREDDIKKYNEIISDSIQTTEIYKGVPIICDFNINLNNGTDNKTHGFIVIM